VHEGSIAQVDGVTADLAVVHNDLRPRNHSTPTGALGMDAATIW
jgi:hypothetical protein